MAFYRADNDGKVTITVVEGDTRMSFKVGGVDGHPFAPNTTVEIPDLQLAGVIEKLGRAVGLGGAGDEYRQSLNPSV
jgi:hypothetical protein